MLLNSKCFFATNQKPYLHNTKLKISIVLDFIGENFQFEYVLLDIRLCMREVLTFKVFAWNRKVIGPWLLSINQNCVTCCVTFELSWCLSPYGVYCNVVHPGNYISVNTARNSNILRLLNLMTRPFSRSTVSLIDLCLIYLCN